MKLYKSTENVVRIIEKSTESFWTAEGLRQGCPLNPTMFPIYISEKEQTFNNGQGQGTVLINFKIIPITSS